MSETASASGNSSSRFDQKQLGRIVLGTVFLLVSIGYLVHSLGMPQGTVADPGPGMFPVWVGVVAIIVCLIVIAEAALGRSESGDIDFPRGQALKVSLIFMGTLLGYVLLLPFLGQYLSSVIYVILFLRFGGQVTWPRSIITGLAIGVGLTFVFTELLNLPLPQGSLIQF